MFSVLEGAAWDLLEFLFCLIFAEGLGPLVVLCFEEYMHFTHFA
jgi:hypothetical protein